MEVSPMEKNLYAGYILPDRKMYVKYISANKDIL